MSSGMYKTISNLVWRFAERCGAQGIALFASIILARILEPEDYGMISLVMIFINILQVLVDFGFRNALIQKKNVDDLDFSTVFCCNIFFSCVLYVGLYFLAPSIAAFYDNKTLISIVRVLGMTVIIAGVKNVKEAYVSKQFIFKRFFYSTLGGTIGSTICGIYLAYRGYGIWALVVQQVSNVLLDTIILWIIVEWRPKKYFSFTRLKTLLSYGWKILASSLIDTVYKDIRELIIGKVYSPASLAYYNRGKQFPDIIAMNVSLSVDTVLLSVLSDNQDDRRRIKNMMRRAIRMESYILWPIMFGLMAIGEKLVRIVLTEKWVDCVPYLCIFSFISGMEMIQTINLNAIKAIGRSDIFLKMEILKKSVGIIIVLITINISMLAIGIGAVIYTIVSSFVNIFPNRQLLNYSFFEQISDIMPSFLLSAFMTMVVWKLPISYTKIYVQLIIQILMGVIIYLAGSVAFKLEGFQHIKTAGVRFIKNELQKNS